MRNNKRINGIIITASVTALLASYAYAEDIPNIIIENDTAATELLSEPQKAIYTEYVFGDSLESDVSTGQLGFYSGADLERCEPSAESHDLPYICRNHTGDIAVMRTEKDGSPCVLTSQFCRPLRKDSPVTTGNVTFDAGPSFTVDDHNLTFEVEYFDTGTKPFSILYVSGLNSGNFRTVSIPVENTNTWKTFKLNVTNAHFNRSTSTGLVDGFADFRVESAGHELYVRRVAVYTCSTEDFDTLNSDLQNLSLPIDTSKPIDEGFELPVLSNSGAEITWTSDSQCIKTDGNIADVSLAPTVQNVTLTARVMLNNRYLEKTFAVQTAAEPYKAHALTIGKESWSTNSDKRRISVPVTDADKASGDCMLLLTASDKSSGIIKSLVTDSHRLGAESSFTLSAETDFSEDLKYDFYVLNLSGSPLRNAPPAPPVLKSRTSNRTLYVQWDKSADDFDAVSEYAVFIDGKETGKVSEASAITGEINTYILENAQENKEYDVSVIAYDHDGLASEAAHITASLEKMASVDLADPEGSSDGLSFIVNDDVSSGDSHTVQIEKEGVICRKNVDRKPINGRSLTFLYFTADRSIISSDEPNVTVMITYFDEGTGSVLLQYNALGGAIAKQVTAANLTDSKTWKTAVVKLTDANFTAPPALTNSDFRITASSGEICISKVAAIPTEKY